MLKQNLLILNENQELEGDEEEIKEKQLIEELQEKLKNLYKKLEPEND